MTITYTELFLLILNIAVVAYAFKLQSEMTSTKRFLILMLENEDAREQLLSAHKKFIESRGA